ncbi:MAG: tetratricopeptide repeat protein [Nitrosomonas sp.]|nr:tetratricopeptide repeat protein [Nitrosomonas sp.]MDP1949710.1 tetratricopeptide repeat protein [Nitrosomonas sp.]
MKVIVVLSLVASLMMLSGCGEEAPSSKSETESPFMLMDELTSMNEIPSFIGEGLSPEEKEKLMSQILPSGSDDEKDSEEKFKELLKKANAGNAKAQNELGVMYYTGEAVSKTDSGHVLDNDPGLAVGWFYRSAEQGYADAQFNLGLMYANGEGIEQDMAQAVELFKRAAEQGNIDAQNNLGAMYFTGEGVPRDERKAIEWFEKAAAQGSADAKANLDAIRTAGY